MREDLIAAIKRELVGPDLLSHRFQENNEEILELAPRERYAVGILFPQHATAEQLSFFEQLEYEQFGTDTSSESSPVPVSGSGTAEEVANEEIDSVNLSNTYMPSAMGFSCIVSESCKYLDISISAGRYEEFKVDSDAAPKIKSFFKRIGIEHTFRVDKNDFPRTAQQPFEKAVKDTALNFYIHKRIKNANNSNAQYYSFTLVNTNKTEKEFDDKKCFFQVYFSVGSDTQAPFLPLPDGNLGKNHQDDESLLLLYRNIKAYAIGHGCSVTWDVTEQGCSKLETESIPAHPVLSIVPTHFQDLKLSMRKFASATDDKSQLDGIHALCIKYQDWIETQDDVLNKTLADEQKAVGLRHINHCRTILTRMKKGLSLLQENETCRRAFALANEAMVLQQLHYNLPLRKAKIDNTGSDIQYEKCEIGIENIDTIPETGVLSEKYAKYGEWYSFQLAFILININSFWEPMSDDRKIADLIWFPTGGGKTEAYLGLAAFVIFLRRLINAAANGTTVLMRYTLRLLTSQQFLRASSLICACELIRQREKNLGDSPITLGLWIGDQSAPNKRDDAVEIWRKLYNSQTDENKFVLLKCPWCGAEMGVLKQRYRNFVIGYEHTLTPSTIRYLCKDKTCTFSQPNNYLPLFIIDEDIYENPPTLIIGTVDKFAMLVWKPEARSLFGISADGLKTFPPELIIQDELHLISSALGSVVGHYETLINSLATKEENGVLIAPKIVASTATISRAREQISALYGRSSEHISIFPPQGLEIGDSFFSQITSDDPGRLYIGVFPAGLISKISAQVRLTAALLQGVQDASVTEEKERDPYWTLIEYFNSLRELGTAATLVTSYLGDYLKTINVRKRQQNNANIPQKQRYIQRYIELTSRIPGHMIPGQLQLLEKPYTSIQETQKPVDICLATNMISVGLDVQRLGLMVVIGQPKLTSEYIQATSRIGRSASGPGLIVTLYNPFRSRDRSYYEQFHQYHGRFYQYVEPSSVTPFSKPVCDKALHAILVGLVRFLGSKENAEFPTPLPTTELLEKIKKIILDRISISQPDELESSRALLDDVIKRWKLYQPAVYGSPANHNIERCLMYPAGTFQNEEIVAQAWPTLMSMRDVERNCELLVLPREYDESKDPS